MAYANREDLKRRVCTALGSITIGDEENDTLSIGQANKYLADANSELKLQTGETTPITNADKLRIAVELECQYVKRRLINDLWLDADKGRALLERTETEIKKLLKMLTDSTAQQYANDTYIDPSYSVFELPAVLEEDVNE